MSRMHVLRTVPTFVTAHTFCASRDTRASYGWCLVFARIKTMWRNQNLESAFGIQNRKIGGNHASFNLERNAIHCFVFYCFLE